MHWVSVFLVLNNGNLAGYFRSSRGIRQGDVLSPFLFNMTTKVLRRVIRRAQEWYISRFQGGSESENIPFAMILCDADIG